LNSVFFLLPAVQTKPSSLQRLQGDSPSHLDSVRMLFLQISKTRRLTFVFFILHLSHAFHTLLCLPSITTAPCSCEEFDLFEVLFNGFDCLDEDFLIWCGFRSSMGGVGRLDIVIATSESRKRSCLDLVRPEGKAEIYMDRLQRSQG
jgi:hypothetical protein